MELTREEKIKIFEKLPKELQELMESEDTGAFLLYLGDKNNLANDKIHLLSKILGDVILGILPPANIAKEINTQVATDPQVAVALAKELNDLIASAEAGSNVSVAPEILEAPAVINLRKPAAPPVPAPPSLPPVSNLRPSAPEIIDLRKTPPPLPHLWKIGEGPTPVSPAPIPPRPLTFTKPILPPTPLIEASPHENLSRLNLDRSADTYREKIDDSPLPPILPKPPVPIAKPSIAKSEEIARPKEPEKNDESFILRPPGFPPL